MKLKSSPVWKRIRWPYNHAQEYAAWECWQIGRVILYAANERGTNYVASYGANDDRSHSGFLPGLSMEEAKRELIRRRENNLRPF